MISERQRIRLWDIETEPAPMEYLERVMPAFEAPSNWKDPLKINAAIKEKRDKWIDMAATEPTTGRILSVAFQWLDDPASLEIHHDDEAGLIERVFAVMRDASMGASYKLAGFATSSFDIPFTVKRAFALGIPVPPWLMPNGQAYWKPPPWLIDLRMIWTFGDRTGSGSLDDVSVFLGGPAKQGSGANYARLWHNPQTREQALQYQRSEFAALTVVANKLLPRYEVTESQPGREEG